MTARTRTPRPVKLNLPDSTTTTTGMASRIATIYFEARQSPFRHAFEWAAGHELYNQQRGRGISTTKMSKETGISRSVVQRIEAGLFIRTDHEDEVRLLANRLDIPLMQLRRIGADAVENRGRLIADDTVPLSLVYRSLEGVRGRHPERFAESRDFAMGLGLLLHNANLTSRQLSASSRVNPGYVALLLEGLIPPELRSENALSAIAKALKTTVEEITHLGANVRTHIPLIRKDSKVRAFNRGDPDTELWE